MRISNVLFKQHIGWHFAKNWRLLGKRKPWNTGAEKILKLNGAHVYQPEDILKEKKTFEPVKVVGYKDKPQPLDETHPNWHDEVLLTYKDHNALLEGLPQAKCITNTVELKEGLPDNYEVKDIPKDVHKRVKSIILNSHLFDGEQKKLPIIKDPERPAWNFPRLYGVTQDRRNKLIISRLLQLTESRHCTIAKERYLYSDLLFSFPFKHSSSTVQFSLTGDTVLCSSKSLSPVTDQSTGTINLPDIYPLSPTVTLNEENIYKLQNIYPIKASTKSHPHTLFVHYDSEVVKNLFEEQVTETQIFARSLLKGFTVAASYAKAKYGVGTKHLPEPVTLQVVQTDGHFFHFGVLQLNTLDFENSDVKNVWYQTPLQHLFTECSYKAGKPVLEGYSGDVIKQLDSFYTNK